MAKIKIPDDLYEKVKAGAARAGYSSAEEFIAHVLEKSVAGLESADDQEKAKEKLKGLGYIG
ncbi:MAG: hypothetical protein NTV79_06175 [Candidatus Aureabacteria bacterium]|nr:hypothetical protein [Candidatus Auribacterota bacterium]